MHPNLRIVVVAPDLVTEDSQDEHAVSLIERSKTLRIGLLENGYNLIATLPADVFLAERIAQLQPDLIIVDAESDARDALEHVVMATRDERRAIVLFTDDEDTSHVNEAVAAGVSAYIVDVAMARFEHEQRLRTELSHAQEALVTKNVVNQAKTLIMKRQKISEPEAYAKIRKIAMNKGLKLADVSQQIIDMAELWL